MKLTKQYSTQFERLPVGAAFSKNGYKWMKRSTKTAEIASPGEPYHRKWFWFRQNDNVIINHQTRVTIN